METDKYLAFSTKKFPICYIQFVSQPPTDVIKEVALSFCLYTLAEQLTARYFKLFTTEFV